MIKIKIIIFMLIFHITIIGFFYISAMFSVKRNEIIIIMKFTI